MTAGFKPIRMVAAAMLAGSLMTGCGPKPQGPVAEARTTYIDARATLLAAAQDPDVVTRIQALEALAATLGPRAGVTYVQALSDPNPTARFAAAMAIGDSKYAPAKDRLQLLARKGTGERNKFVFCAIIYALHELGDVAHMTELPGLLFDREKEIRASAALVMGKMNEPSAARPLKMLDLEEKAEVVQIQIRESLAMLGEEGAAMRLEGDAKLPSDGQIPAIDALGRIGSWRAVRVLQNLLTDDNPPLVRVAAAGGLARAGEVDEGTYALCVEAVRDPEGVLRRAAGPNRRLKPVDVSALQRLGAISLGLMKRPLALDELHPLLSCEDGAVRVAAAMAVLTILSQYNDAFDLTAKPPAAVQPVAAVEPFVPPQPAPEPVAEEVPTLTLEELPVAPAVPPAPSTMHISGAKD